MTVFNYKANLQAYLNQLKSAKKTIGFVPTMGALHDGHLALVKEALEKTDHVVVSIFVNPTQFDNSEDLEKYPRTLDNDVDLLKSVSDNISVYAPTANDVYDNHIISQKFSFDGLEHEMEGKFRSGHFDGVGTVVKKLIEIVRPDFAFFGKKDFQQLQIIKKLVSKHDLKVKIIGCNIYREPSGLAMSSRNVRLSKEHKSSAPFIFNTLKEAKVKFGTKSASKVTEWVEQQFKKHPLLELEYFIIADTETLKTIKRKTKHKTYRAFIAVYAGPIRLIDNIALN